MLNHRFKKKKKENTRLQVCAISIQSIEVLSPVLSLSSQSQKPNRHTFLHNLPVAQEIRPIHCMIQITAGTPDNDAKRAKRGRREAKPATRNARSVAVPWRFRGRVRVHRCPSIWRIMENLVGGFKTPHAMTCFVFFSVGFHHPQRG